MPTADNARATVPHADKRRAPTPVVQYNISDKGVASIDANVALRSNIVQQQLNTVARLREASARAGK